MKTLKDYIKSDKSSLISLFEKLVINKDYSDDKIVAKSFDELRNIIEDRYDKLGSGTEKNPINFNDIDVSNIVSFCNKNKGIFEKTEFEYIDISYWDVSNVKNMSGVFSNCEKLESVGDLSNWNISNVEYMHYMFDGCENLNIVGDLSNWDVSNVEDMYGMFYDCQQLKSVGDLSKWNVSKVKDMRNMFYRCSIEDKYKPKIVK